MVTSSQGCDSSITLNLTIVPSSSNTTDVSVCSSYLWAVNGATYTTSGTYTALNGCVNETLNLTITNTIVLSVNTNPTTTTGGADGEAFAMVSGGTVANDYNYSWSNGSVYANATGLSAGWASVTVSDDNGCSVTDSGYVNGPNCQLAVSVSGTDALCEGSATGSATASASNGSAPYSYSWSNGFSSASVSNLAPGTYQVDVTDAAGCVESGQVTINEPAAIASSVDQTSCGSYTWSANGETYSASGSYTAVLTSVNGCDSTVTLNLTITATANSNTTTASVCDSYTWSVDGNTYTASGIYSSVNGCNTEILDLTITASTSNSTTVNTCSAYTWAVNGNTYSTSGTYSSVNGCNTEFLVLTISNASSITLSVNTNPTTTIGGADGEAFAIVSGGTVANDYNYNWSNGSTISSASGLSAGWVSVTVTDDNGCSAADSGYVNGPSCQLVVTVTGSDALCEGSATGSATVSASNGLAPYSYVWSNGATTATATGLSAGVYQVSVTDAAGCVESGQVTINEPGAISSSVTETACGSFTWSANNET
jgi:hypothetical protein